MNTHAVFAGEDYYPHGGWEDHHSLHTSLTSAREAAHKLPGGRKGVPGSGDQWWHIVDLQSGKIVEDAYEGVRCVSSP